MLRDAQSNMRRNYINGGPGVFVSGVVWLAAAFVTHTIGFQLGMLTLFVGGMLIVPISGLIEKSIGEDTPAPDNGLTRLALLTLPLLFGGLFLGYLMSSQNEAYFFEIVAVAIGVRYLIFSRIYGLGAFIVLGLILITIGTIAHVTSSQLTLPPLAVGTVEVVFGIFLTRKKID